MRGKKEIPGRIHFHLVNGVSGAIERMRKGAPSLARRPGLSGAQLSLETECISLLLKQLLRLCERGQGLAGLSQIAFLRSYARKK